MFINNTYYKFLITCCVSQTICLVHLILKQFNKHKCQIQFKCDNFVKMKLLSENLQNIIMDVVPSNIKNSSKNQLFFQIIPKFD